MKAERFPIVHALLAKVLYFEQWMEIERSKTENVCKQTGKEKHKLEERKTIWSEIQTERNNQRFRYSAKKELERDEQKQKREIKRKKNL